MNRTDKVRGDPKAEIRTEKASIAPDGSGIVLPCEALKNEYASQAKNLKWRGAEVRVENVKVRAEDAMANPAKHKSVIPQLRLKSAVDEDARNDLACALLKHRAYRDTWEEASVTFSDLRQHAHDSALRECAKNNLDIFYSLKELDNKITARCS